VGFVVLCLPVTSAGVTFFLSLSVGISTYFVIFSFINDDGEIIIS